MSKTRSSSSTHTRYRKEAELTYLVKQLFLLGILMPELQYHMASRALASEIPVKRWLIVKNYLEDHPLLLLPRRKDLSGGNN